MVSLYIFFTSFLPFIFQLQPQTWCVYWQFEYTMLQIAQKYLSDPVLFHRDDIDADVKFDVRYIVMLLCAEPLKVYRNPVGLIDAYCIYTCMGTLLLKIPSQETSHNQSLLLEHYLLCVLHT